MVVLFLLYLSCFFFLSVSASPDTLHVSTGDIDIASGVKVKINYTASALVSHPSTIGRGESDWSINLYSGNLGIAVYLPSPISRWYSASMGVPIGTYWDITVYTGISVRVRITSSASLDCHGDAGLSTDYLFWSSEGTKTFRVHTYHDGSGMILVESSFGFQIDLALVVGISPLSIEVADTNIGTFSASPKLQEVVTISIPWYDQIRDLVFSPLGLLILFMILFIAFPTIAMVISARRKRKQQERISKRVSVRKNSRALC